eukprot:scaffold13227_cov117-Isochrysis_galbana.AAC.12
MYDVFEVEVSVYVPWREEALAPSFKRSGQVLDVLRRPWDSRIRFVVRATSSSFVRRKDRRFTAHSIELILSEPRGDVQTTGSIRRRRSVRIDVMAARA